jgi:hypothetical protein
MILIEVVVEEEIMLMALKEVGLQLDAKAAMALNPK